MTRLPAGAPLGLSVISITLERVRECVLNEPIPRSTLAGSRYPWQHPSGHGWLVPQSRPAASALSHHAALNSVAPVTEVASKRIEPAQVSGVTAQRFPLWRCRLAGARDKHSQPQCNTSRAEGGDVTLGRPCGEDSDGRLQIWSTQVGHYGRHICIGEVSSPTSPLRGHALCLRQC